FKIFKRKTQVVYPKDIGTIVLLADICPGSLVVEAGTGSGFLTAILANFVKPSGKVFTYEVRREFQEVAIKNLTMVGLERYVEFKLKDIRKGIDEKEVDAVILDMPDPWNVADIAFSSLRSGGKIVCFLPTINQVERVVETLKERGFIMIEVREILERTYKVKRGETRPEVFMIGHTGYIVSGGKP
ncbi:MAG TPA: tRNA (adenine-N1)-methyltransferase, partial [Thermofilum sp.]|nr:tRNA (adenine-N1)-methyltransferase [Thermofilum sp.]